jgi:outer membrane lipoprotein SlyB
MKSLYPAFVFALVLVFSSLGAAPPAWAQSARIGTVVATAPPLRIDGFDVEQVAALGPGTPLHFSLYGSAGAAARLHIEGAARTLPLQEVQAGLYEGTYVVGTGEAIAPDSRVTADLRLHGGTARAVLQEALMLGAAPPQRCADCAVVETIRTVQERERPGVLGAVAGGMLGAILGSQVGDGDGRTAAGVLGAVGGAVLGREIERSRGARTRYDVALRGPDGGLQWRRYDAPPPFRVGDRVRVPGGDWHPEPVAARP